MNAQDYDYLIIGGAPKAGTTSLYRYLADHPDVCASSIKETRFFLDAEYPLPSASRYDDENLQDYNAFFQGRGRLRVEATPDYLYSDNAKKVATLLPKAKMVFILRDPVERMVSWYKFAKQKGFLDQKVDFESYVLSQLNVEITDETPVHMRALDQCAYDQYLMYFERAFDARLLLISFDELVQKPREIMHQICLFSEINSEFFNDYNFKAENVSSSYKFPKMEKYLESIRRFFVYKTHNFPWINRVLRLPYIILNNLLRLSRNKANLVEVSESLKRIIYSEIERNNKSNMLGSHE